MEMPKHIAMILDGNRRWAKKYGKNVLEGHRAGAVNIRNIITYLHKKGVHTITIWIFSTENWHRESLQVRGLMALFQEFAYAYLSEAMKNGARIVHLGRKDRIPSGLRKKFEAFEKKTEHLTDHCLNIAMDYGGRDEVIRAVQHMMAQGVAPKDVTEASFNNFLDTAGQKYPEPDIIIRTGGERRMSGFLIWQGVYAEYFFPEKFLPEMTTDDLDAILDEYNNRDRRFGK